MTDIYRDPTDGATARRVDLLRRRRDELVTMPHAIRRVVVARGARIAAAWAMSIVGALLVGSAASPRIAKLVGHVLPPDDPAVIATGLLAAWLGGALVYAIARAICEHRFTIAMTKCVLPGDDLHDDLERLAHDQPDELARRMAHGLEVRSAALPVLAAAFVAPATFVYCALAVKAHGWPANRVIEHTLGDRAGFLVAGGVLGLFASLFVLAPRLRSPRAVVPAGVVAATALVFVVALHGIPASWYALPFVAIGGMIAVTARKLRIERAWIETEDPAAGGEIFDVLAARFAQLRRFVVAHRGYVALVIGTLALGFTGHGLPLQFPTATPAPTHIFATTFPRAAPAPVVEKDDLGDIAVMHTKIHVTRAAFNAIIYDLSLWPGENDVHTGLVIPPGWEGRIEAHVDLENTTAKDYEIDGIGTITPKKTFDIELPSVCTTDAPRSIKLHVIAKEAGQIRLIVQPTLRASKC